MYITYSFIFCFHIYKQSKQVVKRRISKNKLIEAISKNSYYSKYN